MFFKVDFRLQPYSITFCDLFFRSVKLNRHIEVILRKIADEKLHQRMTVRNMSTIYHIFKAFVRNDPLPSSHKIQLRPKLRYVLGARSVDLFYSKVV